MKTRINFLFNTFIILAFLAVELSCKKKPTPPAPTPTAVVPSFSFTALGITTTGVQYTISNPTTGPLQITASNASSNSNYQTVVITINNTVNAAGTFTLSTSNTGVYTSGSSSSIKYTTNAIYTGTINITKVDMVNRLMSASYSFVAEQISPSSGNSGTISGTFTDVGF